MTPPKCCGKPAKPFIKRWAVRGIIQSIMTGFQCQGSCKHIGVPFFSKWDGSYMSAMEAVRLEGIAFDETFNKS